jgi:hypothetical protein
MFDTVIGIGHMTGTLFVARRYQLNFVTHVVQSIENTHVTVATDTKDVRDTLLNQGLGD